jgi:hypothetical protein
MKTIQRIIQIPLSELQTGRALNMDITISDCCCICGKKIKKGAKYKQVQLMTNGNIVSTDQDVDGSQGFFLVGSECVKRLVIKFSF